jgi:hypothetical protein
MGIVIVWSAARVAASFYRAFRYTSVVGRTDAAFVASALAGGVATVVNPYGARLLDFLVQPASFLRPDITEWQSTPIARVYGAIYLIFLAMACGNSPQ